MTFSLAALAGPECVRSGGSASELASPCWDDRAKPYFDTKDTKDTKKGEQPNPQCTHDFVYFVSFVVECFAFGEAIRAKAWEDANGAEF